MHPSIPPHASRRRGTRHARVLRTALVSVLCPALAGCLAEADGTSRDRGVPSDAVTAAPPPGLDSVLVREALDRAAELPRLRCLVVARHGEIRTERCFNGAAPDRPANIKSVSKSVLSALVGIAVHAGELEGPDQAVAPFFADRIPDDGDPMRQEITVGHLLSMQAGLERTSGGNYGRWVTSPDWVRYAITRPMVAEPGGAMLYSTGSSHLLSAILTQATGESTLRFARERLARPLGIELPAWPTDPQGIYFGGNEMRMSPRDLVRFGELYRNDGVHEGEQVVPAEWIRDSLRPRTRSRWSGESYGYGWFVSEVAGYSTFYGWGYGGQYLYVIPDLELTVAVTSDPEPPADRGHRRTIRELLEGYLVPAAVKGE